MTVSELWVELGFKADTAKLNDFIRGMGELNMTSVIAALGVTGLALAMTDLISKSMDYAEGLVRFQSETGQTTEYMERLDKMVHRLGGSTGDAKKSLVGLGKALYDIQMGNAGQNTQQSFALLRMPNNLSPEEASKFIRARFGDAKYWQELAKEYGHIGAEGESWTANLKNQILAGLGMTATMKLYYEASKDADDEMQNIAVTSQDVKRSLHEMSEAWAKAGESMQHFGIVISSKVLPIIKMLIMGIEQIFDLETLLEHLGTGKESKEAWADFTSKGPEMRKMIDQFLGVPTAVGSTTTVGDTNVNIHVTGSDESLVQKIEHAIRNVLDRSSRDRAKPII
jgi:uncharacterized protein YukE